MKKTRRLIIYITLGYFTLLTGFTAGLVVMHQKIWPYDSIFEIYHFIKGHVDEDTGLVDKVLNDLGVVPSRHFGNSIPVGQNDADELFLENLKERRHPPKLYKTPDFLDSYLLVTGIFDFNKSLNGAILIDLRTSEVTHQWYLYDELFFNSRKNYDHHLFALLKDGSVMFAKDEGDGALYRYGACGNLIWQIPGNFHHSINERSDGLYWVLGSPVMPNQTKDALSLLDAEKGEIVKTILLSKVHSQNGGAGIFDLNWTNMGQDDKFHANDADPLPNTIADSFPEFEEGDLLISYRHADLIYVLDPNTLKVRWWAQGLTSGQHDPDWQIDGSITVFDNAVHTGGRVNIQRLSTVTADTHKHPSRSSRSQVILDGVTPSLFTATRGRHQFFQDQKLLLVVPDQGRAIVFSKEGEVILEFINWYDKSRVLHINNAQLIARDFVENNQFAACAEE